MIWKAKTTILKCYFGLACSFNHSKLEKCSWNSSFHSNFKMIRFFLVVSWGLPGGFRHSGYLPLLISSDPPRLRSLRTRLTSKTKKEPRKIESLLEESTEDTAVSYFGPSLYIKQQLAMAFFSGGGGEVSSSTSSLPFLRRRAFCTRKF